MAIEAVGIAILSPCHLNPHWPVLKRVLANVHHQGFENPTPATPQCCGAESRKNAVRTNGRAERLRVRGVDHRFTLPTGPEAKPQDRSALYALRLSRAPKAGTRPKTRWVYS